MGQLLLPLASTAPTPAPAPRSSVRPLLLVLLVMGLLGRSTLAQLLFPVNQPQVHLALDSTCDPTLRNVDDRALRVAIVGAGAAGSSAAYFLSRFNASHVRPVVTVFESAEYVGGRSTVVYPWNDDVSSPAGSADTEEPLPVELGASIFVQANKNLLKAQRVFNLTVVPAGGEDGGGMAIWDGHAFVHEESDGFGWGWSYVKLFWRYGRSPLRVRALVATTVESFTSLYSTRFALGPFDTIDEFARALNLSRAASVSAETYFAEEGVSPLFVDELVAAATTVNYGQSPASISALGALVSLAAEGASAIAGGNRRIFAAFIEHSRATLHLRQKVSNIIKLDGSGHEGKGSTGRPQWVVQTPNGGGTYDAVILATPLGGGTLNLVNSKAKIPPQSYVHLHVSFVITNASTPRSDYFGVNRPVAKSVFSTFSTPSSLSSPPEFNSLSYILALPPSTSAKFGPGAYHVVKLFSAQPLSDQLAKDLFGETEVAKIVRKEWDAYPVLKPVTEEKEWALVRPDKGLYYVNAFERLISTMETEVSRESPPCNERSDAGTDDCGGECGAIALKGLLRVRTSDQLGRVGGGLVGRRGTSCCTSIVCAPRLSLRVEK